MATSTEKARTHRINVRLAEDLLNRLNDLGERMGIAPSTLAAVAIAEYINSKDQQREQAKMMSAMMSRQMGSAFADKMADPEFVAAITAVLGEDED